MSHLDLSGLEEAFADRHGVEHPVGFLGVLGEPWFVVELRLDSIHVLKVLIFAEDLNLLLQLFDFIVIVDRLCDFAS